MVVNYVYCPMYTFLYSTCMCHMCKYAHLVMVSIGPEKDACRHDGLSIWVDLYQCRPPLFSLDSTIKGTIPRDFCIWSKRYRDTVPLNAFLDPYDSCQSHANTEVSLRGGNTGEWLFHRALCNQKHFFLPFLKLNISSALSSSSLFVSPPFLFRSFYNLHPIRVVFSSSLLFRLISSFSLYTIIIFYSLHTWQCSHLFWHILVSGNSVQSSSFHIYSPPWKSWLFFSPFSFFLSRLYLSIPPSLSFPVSLFLLHFDTC
jgi:hypothetical protein